MDAARQLSAEAARVEAVRGCGLLDTPPEADYDELAKVARLLCHTEAAAIYLVDADRAWAKSQIGAAPAVEARDGFAGRVVDACELLVEQAAEGLLAFRIGAPLRTSSGVVLGALCAMDRTSRPVADEQREALKLLARQVTGHIELWRRTAPLAAANAELTWALGRLRENEARLRAILDTAVEGIITIDQRGMVESFNPAAERLFGYKAREVVGRNVSMLMDEPHQSRHDGYMEAYRTQREPKIIGRGREVVGLRKDGSQFPIWLAVSEVKLADQTLFTGFLRDISELKAVEKMKDEFVAIVSHELRTPLTAIHVSLGLLGEAAAAAASAAQAEELVAIARGNTGRLIRLVNDILDLQKIEAGRFELSLREHDAGELIDGALSGLEALARQGNVQLRREGGARLTADGDRLLQVLTNLVSNALKFAPARTEVVVTAGAIGEQVRFEVRDRGPGISLDDQRRLFAKFEQLPNSGRGGRVGTGLGLAISKALVEQHGGRIGVESRPGEGSTFWFELPREARPGRRPPLPEAPGR